LSHGFDRLEGECGMRLNPVAAGVLALLVGDAAVQALLNPAARGTFQYR
jgi:hypothetical protein